MRQIVSRIFKFVVKIKEMLFMKYLFAVVSCYGWISDLTQLMGINLNFAAFVASVGYLLV